MTETLTKRELIAAMALQGCLTSLTASESVEMAVWLADELLAELEATESDMTEAQRE